MSGFSFGGVRASQRPTKISSKVESIIDENVSSDYVLILTDHVPSKAITTLLLKDIKKWGVTSYIIVSALNEQPPRDKKLNTEELLAIESNWHKYLKFNDFKARAVVTMGHALYCAARTTDVIPYHFQDDKLNSPRIWLSDEFANAGDLWYYPAHSLTECYPIETSSDYINFKTRFFYTQLNRAMTYSKDPSKHIDMSSYEIKDVVTIEQAKQCLVELMNSDLLSFDLETTGLDFLSHEIGCITLCNDGATGFFIPWNLIVEGKLKRQLAATLMSAKRLVGANGKFDTKFLWRNGVAEKQWVPTDDTMIFSQDLNSDLPKGLKPLAYRYTYFGNYDSKLDEVKKALKVDNYMQIPHEHLLKYAGLDAIVTHRVFSAELAHARLLDKRFPNDKLSDWTVERWYTDVMIPFYQEAIRLEYEGFYVNEDQRARVSVLLKQRIAEARKKLVDTWNPILREKGKPLIADDVNLLSQKQIGKILEDMGWPKVEESESGGYSTSDVCQTEWRRLGLKGVDELADLRMFSVALGSFVGYEKEGKKYGWAQFVREHDDGSFRMHPNFNVMGTETFRCSVREPSTQNIPARGLMGQLVKQCLTTPKMTPNYTVTDDSGRVWTGEGSDYVVTKRGEVQFCSLREDDEILDYGRKCKWVVTPEAARVNMMSN